MKTLMNVRAALLLSSVVVTSLSAMACVTRTDEEPKAQAPTNEALAFTTHTHDEVAGSYRENGVALVFRIRREGDARFVALSTSTGQALVDSEYRAGIDHARVLGGRLVERGGVGDEPTLEGDRSALDELLAMPEAKLVAPLKDALIAAKVDPFLVGRELPAAGNVSPTAYYDGRSWYLGYWEQASFPTWSFWGVTTVTVEYQGGTDTVRACAELSVSGCPEYLCTDPTYWGGNNPRSIQRQWGGLRLYVRNTGYWTRYQCGSWTNGGWNCVNGRCNDRTVKVHTD